MKLLIYIFVFLFIFFIGIAKADSILINYYCDKIEFTSIQKIKIKLPGTLDDKYLVFVSDEFNKNPELQTLSKELDSVSQKLDLCNWFKYKLIELYVKQCFPKVKTNEQFVFIWYLLNKQGFDARLNLGKKSVLFARMESLKGSKYNCVDVGAKRFLIISNDLLSEYYVSQLSLNGKKSLLFKLSDLKPPKLVNIQLIDRKIVVRATGDSIPVKYKINKTLIDIYNDFPGLGFQYLFNVPLSDQCAQSILPQLCLKLITKDTVASVRNLLAFTQNVATYEADETAFGYEKPMTPEEVLYYPKSDCEDRAALFYYLVKTFFQLPVLGLYYPQHVNIAVFLKSGSYDNIFLYKNRNYVVCEPTLIGEATLGYSNIFPRYKNPKVEVEFDPIKNPQTSKNPCK